MAHSCDEVYTLVGFSFRREADLCLYYGGHILLKYGNVLLDSRKPTQRICDMLKTEVRHEDIFNQCVCANFLANE